MILYYHLAQETSLYFHDNPVSNLGRLLHWLIYFKHNFKGSHVIQQKIIKIFFVGK